MKTARSDWSFANIPDGFDSHVREQLPWYDLVVDMVSFLVINYARRDAVIYDIGSSTGNVKQLLEDTIHDRTIKYITIDNEECMSADICANAQDVEYGEFDIAILNLTMMFIQLKDRRKLLDLLYYKMNIGGCLIIVDKFIQPEDYLSTVLRRATIWWKHKNGICGDAIVNKELSLSGVQIPMRHDELPNGSKCFFKFGEFEGYILTKEK